jgi:hypothetical protein
MHVWSPLVLLGALLAACAGVPTGPSDASLEPLARSQLSELYRRPGVDYSRWSTLYVESPQVHYAKALRGDRRHRKPEDFQLIEREIQVLRKQLVTAIQAAWGDTPGWTVVDEPGPDTLVLQPLLSDFFLYAPIRDDYPGSSRTFARESSRFVLDARLLAPDGELLLESRDQRVTGDRGSRPLTPFSSVVYWRDVHREFQRWARQLQPALVAS